MSPMEYRDVRVADHPGLESLREAVLMDLAELGRAGLDFSGSRHGVPYATLLGVLLAAREAFPGIARGGVGAVTEGSVVSFSNVAREQLAAIDDAWRAVDSWFLDHLAAGTPCYRCGGTGRAVRERVNLGCGFEDVHHETCGSCLGVGITA